MATIPQLGPRRTPQPTRGIATYDPGHEAEAMGGFAKTVGAVAEDLARKQEQEKDAQAVFGARRQIDEWERATLYDSKDGAAAKYGRDAFGLPESVPKSFDDFAGKLMQAPMSPLAKQKVQELVQTRRDQALGFVDRHTLAQRNIFEEGQANADIDSMLQRAAVLTDAGDPARAKAEVQLAQTRAIGFMKSRGKSEEEIAAKTLEISSKAAITTVNTLLERDKPAEAEAFLKNNAGSLRTDDLLRAQGAVGKAMDARQGLVVAQTVVDATLKPAIAPTDFGRLNALAGPATPERLTELVKMAESGGKRNGPDGKILTSTKGAKGEMQVLDSTNAKPGYGVVPAKDDSPDERARVGRDYLGAMVKEFKGNVPQALAAYNAGPGAVQKALEQSAKGRSGSADWLSYMPPETQAYVAKISKQYGDGGGAPAMPTLASMQDKVRTMIPPDQPKRRQIAEEATAKMYREILDAKKQDAEQKTVAVYQWLGENGGDFARMPAGLRSNLPPEKIDEAIRFARTMAEGVPVKTDWDTYTQLRAMAVTNRGKFVATDLRLHFPKLGDAQREQLLDLQTKSKDPKEIPDISTLAQQLSVAHNQLGIHSNEKKKGMFDSAVTQAISSETTEKKRALTFEERDKVIKRLMLPTESSWYESESRVYEVAGTSKEGAAKLKIEDDMRKLILAALKAEGVGMPTEEQVRARFNLRFGIR